MDQRKSFFQEVKDGLQGPWREQKALFLSRLWLFPFTLCLTVFAAGILSIAGGLLHPFIFAMTLAFGAGAWLSVMIPTKRDLMRHFTQAVETIDARFVEKKLTQEQAEAALAQASSYAHARNLVWWPLWWLSERRQIKRLIAQHAK